MTIPRWFEERLALERFKAKYLGKPFPVHSTFFLGEIALFCFVVLVGTGLYLALFYEPSAALVAADGGRLPAAYASTLAIDAQPFSALMRRIHHWAAHLMIAAMLLHLVRVYFTAAYKRPREANWVLGLGLLGMTVAASFAGYLLPYDQFSVTATAIGYGIARSVPWIGPTLADYVFAGRFPSPETVPRFFAYHVVLAPLALSALVGLHLLIVLKQKHTELGAAGRPDPVEGKWIRGIPLWPEQTALMGVLFLVIVAVAAALAAFLPVHPSAFFGPPQPATPDVKPDWYLLWIYGALRLIPGTLSFRILGATIGPEAIGAMLVPGIIGLIVVLVPWIDRTPSSLYYAEAPTAGPRRLALGLAVVVLLLALSLAGFGTELGLGVPVLWGITVAAPVATAVGASALARRRAEKAMQGAGVR
ncbi:MAG TPA: cytochrome bc complex cytochrome b subunit [Gemmatimonadales bacterium]|nr:cytochrome bc complex cytochrome b subunit [Gemmatimonadales bacterium]